jgi:integrase/recombinase XerC
MPPTTPRWTPPEAAKLIAAFLDRDNELTRTNYEKDLADFAKHAKSTVIEAVFDLLAHGPNPANVIVGAYRDSMSRDDRRGLSGSTVNRRLAVLRGLIRRARRLGLIAWELDTANVDASPVKDNSGTDLPTLKRMLAIARSEPGAAGRRNYAILRVASETALRRKEIRGINLNDLDFAHQRIRILGKGRRAKEWIHISPTAIAAIQSWIEMRPGPHSGPLFVNLIPGRPHGRLTGAAIHNIVKSIGAKIGVKARPHGIRHTATTEAIRAAKSIDGMTDDQIMTFSRHRDMRSLHRYRDAEKQAQAVLNTAVAKSLDKPEPIHPELR